MPVEGRVTLSVCTASLICHSVVQKAAHFSQPTDLKEDPEIIILPFTSPHDFLSLEQTNKQKQKLKKAFL